MVEETPLLQIHLLGDFCIFDQSGTVIDIRLRSQELLAYLILHRHTPQPRRRVAAVLWPDDLESQARTHLRKELHYLRRTFPIIEQIVVITPRTLHWHPQGACQVDLEIFETTLATAEDSKGHGACQKLESALGVYRDDLWPDCEADWLYPERERLRQRHVRALAQTTRRLQELGETAKAITLGRQWLQAAPLDEGGYQTLMALYGEMDDRATALQLYHQCMTALQTELGVSPSATTAELYQRLLVAAEVSDDSLPSSALLAGESIPVPAPLPLAPPTATKALVGRDELFPALEQWLLPTAIRSAPLLLLTGEPGIGKTRLLEALAESASHHHFQPCWGRAFAAEQLRSYGVWIDLLRTVSDTELFSSLREVSTDLRDAPLERLPNRGQLLDAIVQGLRAVTQSEQALLLLFDDIHWLDEASTTLLHYVFRSLGHGPLRIACAARGQELQDNPAISSLLKSLRRANRLQEVAVPPLSPEAVWTLVQPLPNPDPDHPLNPQQIYADSGGNPLFALEAARALTQATSTLPDLIDDRLQRLDQAARDLLPWAAALGRRFDPDTLASAAGYLPMQFLTAIEQLEAQQIVCPVPASQADGDGYYDFAHDLVRQVAYDRLSQPRRRLIHRQLAKILNAQTVDDDLASQVAYHAELADDHALAAQAAAAAAARSLRLFAYKDVIQLVAQGLHHCQFLSRGERLCLSAQLLRTRVLAGMATEESAIVESQLQQLTAELEGLSMPEAELIVQEALNFLHYDQGNLATVHQQSLRALDALPPSPQLQAQSLAANGCCLAEIERDMDRAEAVLLEAQAIAERLGLKLIDVATGLGCIERYRGHYGQARTYLQQALQLAQNQRHFVAQGYALSQLAMTGWDWHQPDIVAVQALVQLAKRLPQGSEGSFAAALMALSAYADDPDATEALDLKLHQLNQLDAQRKLVFIASHACEIALAHHQQAAARRYGTMAQQAAQQVGHPNDLVMTGALQVLTANQAAEQQASWQQLQHNPDINDCRCSARARSLYEQAQRVMQPSMAKRHTLQDSCRRSAVNQTM
ncbi:hypothetical protein XM38_023540 [Halomicronema hongdechloris C2206]|uniref:Bacterial transcriptional activator domain-containing protein n=1 Tax=Halomicronema hongdechloris C2206 TaxID=1641165 RepID=A0A1Z3HM52_9CYAN|nr:BTAD domain-containing putative transcriptional regulator [Halomicronema hongdechloris]ASC71402.1 hypothetical protein XM38_023540 [Halomicronema hongdechloris C2206]